MKESNLESIQSHYNKLEDIKNSYESLMQKIGQLQVDLFNKPDRDLEKFLGTLNGKLSQVNQDLVDKTHEYYNEKLLPAQGLEARNSAEEDAEVSEEQNR
ncbi:hypothetical protein [Flavobacterium capsici]|uniref:Uncharacterized protein n=1 Tax=Flavobacterium capsici TaxID=3075618 RepID=A0AA96EYN2_9FLAO|nr:MULTISPECIES: hypothetical protein [unclassified Flavobacterium]WNM17855.1 hypothetical protein RN608_07495 [Flavobacterium sp. PMR2A8]WNM21908.1 hypothetical protein RN605_00795 [Flavobacterium sp. PMTSA4]